MVSHGGDQMDWRDFAIALVVFLAGAGGLYAVLRPGTRTPSPEEARGTTRGEACARLFEAAEQGDADTVERILAGRPSLADAINDQGTSSLHVAAERGHARVVDVLLDAGLDPNLRDRQGRTPLHRADSSAAACPATERLLARGAEVNARDDRGWTPLHAAWNAPAKVQALLRAGADRDATNREGLRPVDVAEALDATRAVRLLRDEDGI